MDAPRIVPGVAPVMDQQMQVVADVDPAQFPDGLDVVICKPGEVTPLGSVRITRGCILLALPPSQVAEHMRQQMRRAVAQQRRAGPGEVRAPGV